jgi:hypothetical protein
MKSIIYLSNGADVSCVSSKDNITGRESEQTSLWCFTRENWEKRLMRQRQMTAAQDCWCYLKQSERMTHR